MADNFNFSVARRNICSHPLRYGQTRIDAKNHRICDSSTWVLASNHTMTLSVDTPLHSNFYRLSSPLKSSCVFLLEDLRTRKRCGRRTVPFPNLPELLLPVVLSINHSELQVKMSPRNSRPSPKGILWHTVLPCICTRFHLDSD